MSNSEWRNLRNNKWYKDIGYSIQDIINRHYYRYDRKGSKPDDPGWHECTCGWEGYWSGFNDHVTDNVRSLVISDRQRTVDNSVHYRNLAISLGAKPEDMVNKFDYALCEKWDTYEGDPNEWGNDQPEVWEESIKVLNHAQRLGAALDLVLHDAHPSYGSTALWHGGIGGQAISSHCSIINGAPPGDEWVEHDLPSKPLREFLHEFPFDLEGHKQALKEELRRGLN